MAAQSGEFDGWFENVSNFDGVVDRTGESEVTVEVGVEANGSALGFGPAAVRITPGTTVTWEWTGEGGGHNVVAEDGTFSSGQDLVSEAGHTYSYTFESTGTYKYACIPHKTLGMKGAVVVQEGSSGGGDSGGSGGDPDYGDWFSDVGNFDGTTVDARGQEEVTVTVGAEGNGGALAFDPPAVHVDNGTTVTWEWTGEGGGHNVVAEDGTFSSGQDLVSEAGHTYSYTFESDGLYEYVCVPHEALGMKGAVVVGDDYPSTGGGGGDGGGGAPVTRPPGATTGLALFAAVLFGALATPLVVGWRHGRHAPAGAAGGAAQSQQVTESAVEEPAEAVGHDEFDPTGTLALVLVYLGILAVMWVFMYFFEFLGNGPTVIG